ncbi:hypothetical protein [Snuella sedimenti]|uniref:Uncharacterized protein n=1 Tax=Snuella sedimenti TaxID=2798802 RepID=A0A8J7J159_9FLAO|nr:hypothetical protein [Snuella sedimenti]MBJ6367004.1 hypothetical protein [Snuella sedimenti]
MRQASGCPRSVKLGRQSWDSKRKAFIFRNWSYYGLMSKKKYKTEKADIELIMDNQSAYEGASAPTR